MLFSFYSCIIFLFILLIYLHSLLNIMSSLLDLYFFGGGFWRYMFVCFFFALAVLLAFSMCFVIFLSWVLCISKKKPPLSVFVDWLSTEEDFNYQSDQRFWAPLKLSLKEGNAFSLGFSYNFPIREINQFFFFFQKLIIFCFVSCLSALFKLLWCCSSKPFHSFFVLALQVLKVCWLPQNLNQMRKISAPCANP